LLDSERMPDRFGASIAPPSLSIAVEIATIEKMFETTRAIDAGRHVAAGIHQAGRRRGIGTVLSRTWRMFDVNVGTPSLLDRGDRA
jgi:hypothetical protein